MVSFLSGHIVLAYSGLIAYADVSKHVKVEEDDGREQSANGTNVVIEHD